MKASVVDRLAVLEALIQAVPINTLEGAPQATLFLSLSNGRERADVISTTAESAIAAWKAITLPHDLL